MDQTRYDPKKSQGSKKISASKSGTASEAKWQSFGIGEASGPRTNMGGHAQGELNVG